MGVLSLGTNTVILEQKDMELVAISLVYMVCMETMSAVFWYFQFQAVPSWCCSLGSLCLPWKDLLLSPEVSLCENLKFDIDCRSTIFHCYLKVMKNKFSLCHCICHCLLTIKQLSNSLFFWLSFGIGIATWVCFTWSGCLSVFLHQRCLALIVWFDFGNKKI